MIFSSRAANAFSRLIELAGGDIRKTERAVFAAEQDKGGQTATYAEVVAKIRELYGPGVLSPEQQAHNRAIDQVLNILSGDLDTGMREYAGIISNKVRELKVS